MRYHMYIPNMVPTHRLGPSILNLLKLLILHTLLILLNLLISSYVYTKYGTYTQVSSYHTKKKNVGMNKKKSETNNHMKYHM